MLYYHCCNSGEEVTLPPIGEDYYVQSSDRAYFAVTKKNRQSTQSERIAYQEWTNDSLRVFQNFNDTQKRQFLNNFFSQDVSSQFCGLVSVFDESLGAIWLAYQRRAAAFLYEINHQNELVVFESLIPDSVDDLESVHVVYKPLLPLSNGHQRFILQMSPSMIESTSHTKGLNAECIKDFLKTFHAKEIDNMLIVADLLEHAITMHTKGNLSVQLSLSGLSALFGGDYKLAQENQKQFTAHSQLAQNHSVEIVEESEPPLSSSSAYLPNYSSLEQQQTIKGENQQASSSRKTITCKALKPSPLS